MKRYYERNLSLFSKIVSIRLISFALFVLATCQLNADEISIIQDRNRLTIKKQDCALIEIIKEIEQQSEYSFFINDNQIDVNTKVNINIKDADINNTLNELLKSTGYAYKIHNKQIAIYKQSVKQTKAPKKVTGTITDENGEPLIGVNITIEGSATGTISDIDGNFSLVLPTGNEALIVSYIGYKEQQITAEKSPVLKIVMKEDAKQLGEVVITAMGIERKAENLTYATQTVGGNELTRSKEANLINSLQGKSAGLMITPNAGGAGSASKILLRGNASILGNNSPLIVVDGVPMSNGISGATDVDLGATLGYDSSGEGSDALSQLNPDDIANITILKGANSAALYGSAASNGVIMVTTKKGKKGSLRVDISSSTTFESPLTLPKFQNTYGGEIVNGPIPRDSWGAPLSELTDKQLSGANGMHLTRNAYDIADFFQTGSNFNNTVALSGGTEKVQTYFSYGNTTADGIYPSNKYQRHNVTFRENFSFFNDKLKINISGNYIYQKVENKYVGGGNQNSALSSLYLGSRSLDMDYYQKNYQQWGTWKSAPYYILKDTGVNGQYQSTKITSILEGPLQNWPYSVISESNNPWWITNMNHGENVSNKIFGSIGLNYQITPELSIQGRFKYDRNMGEDIGKQYANTRVVKSTNDDRGRFNYGSGYTRDIYADAIVSYSRTIKDFQLGANLGGSFTDIKGNSHSLRQAASEAREPYYNENISVNYFDFDGLSLGTGAGYPTSNWERGLFATLQLSYKEMFNLEGSYREDWYRAFTQFKAFGMKQHYGYYSVGGNVLLNKAFKLPSAFNLLKVRASYSEVGNSIPNSLLLNSITKDTATGGSTMGNLQATTDLKPERTASTELGFDLGMFNHAFNLDFTFYNAVMSNQFMKDKGKAGKILIMNTGKVRNRGIEITTSYNLEVNRNFYWKTGINFSYNTNKILSVFSDSQDNERKAREITLSGDGSPIGGGLKVKFIKGGSYGDLYVCDYDRRANGDIIISEDGKPAFETKEAEEYIGNMNSKVNFGWNNTLNYKDFSFYFLFDARMGGKVISFTEAFMDQKGVSERSGKARDLAIANNQYFKPGMPGMTLIDNGKEYNMSVQGYYDGMGGNCGGEYVYDATNIRLREVSASYTFRNLFGISKSLTLSLNARNLFFIYKKTPVDPDMSLSATNALSSIDLFNLPTTRSYGFSIKATF